MPYCIHCGGGLPEVSAFCGSCGRSSESTAVPLPLPPTSTGYAGPPPTAYPSAPTGYERGAGGHGVPIIGFEPPRYGISETDPPPFADPLYIQSPFVSPQRERASWRSIDNRLVGTAIGDAAISLSVLLAVGFIVAMIGGLSFGTSGHHGSIADWVRTAVAVAAASFRGWVSLRITAPDADDLAHHVTLSFLSSPLILTVAILLFTLWLSRRRVAKLALVQNWSSAVVSSLITGVAFGAALAAVTLAARGEIGYGLRDATYEGATSVKVDAFGWSAVVTSAVLIAVASFLGRTRKLRRDPDNRLRRRLAARNLASWPESLAHAVSLIVFSVLVVGSVGVGLELYHVVHHALDVTGGVDGRHLANVLAIGFLGLPIIAIASSAFANGATLSLHGGFAGVPYNDHGVGLVSGGVPGWTYLGFAAAGVLAIAVGMRKALHRSPSVPLLYRWWEVGIAYSVLWLSMWSLCRVALHLFGSNSDLDALDSSGFSDTTQFGLPSLLLSAFAWGTISVVGGRLLARPLAASFPRTLALVGGKRISPEWRNLLADRFVAGNRRVSWRVRPAVDGLPPIGNSPARPLGSGHAWLLVAGVATIASALLVTVPAAHYAGCGVPAIGLVKHDRPIPSSDAKAATVAAWRSEEQGITKAQTAATTAHKRSRVAEQELAKVGTLQSDLATAQDDLDATQPAASTAQDAIDTAQPQVTLDQDDVTTAQDYYDTFKPYDTDNYWLHNLQDAQATLAGDQMILSAAQADLAAANRDEAAAQQRIQSITTALTDARASADKHAPLIVVANDADGNVVLLESTLQQEKAAWQEANTTSIRTARAQNHLAEQCRSESTWRLAPAALLVLATALAATAGYTNRRRRARTRPASRV